MTVAKLIEELQKYPLDKEVYVDEHHYGSDLTGSWTTETDPVIYDLETHLKIDS